MSEVTARQAEWTQRVLGVAVPNASVGKPSGAPPTRTPTAATKAAAVWTEAKDKVDSGISALARALRARPQKVLHRVADEGLFGLTTGGLTVPLTAAILEFDATVGPARAKAARALNQQIANYRTNLTGNPIVRLVDENPFGVDVGLRKTMLDALARLERHASEPA